MNQILFAIMFFLPAGLANATPVFARRIPGLKNWNAPMDFGGSFRGKRVFGDNKTWRGLLSGTVVGGLTAGLEFLLFSRGASGSLIPLIPIVLLGMMLGFGALAGDAIESFFKRQLGVQPGKTWFPFDQIDYILGGLLASALIVRLNIASYVTILITWFVIHLVASYFGYLMGLKSKPI